MEKQKFFEIIRFCLGGIIGVSVYYIILYTLTEYAGVWYLFSSIIAYVFNYISNFFIQKFWTFKNKNTQKIPKQIFLYFVIAGVFFISNTMLLYIFVEYGKISYMHSQIILTIILSIASYFTTKKIFKHD